MDVTTVLQQLQQSDAWDAVQDELLLRALQSLRDGILRQASDTEKQLLASSQRAEAVGLKLRAANCHLEVLAQSQFLEHRIQAEEEEVDPTPTEDLWSSCRVEPVPEVELDAIKKALSLGQSFVENQVIDEMPPLPPVIGSEAWQNSFITNVEDFLGETEPPETPAVAASPEGPEVEEEAHEDLPGSSAVDLFGEVTPSFAAPSAAPEPPNLASQLNALLTRRGGPVEGGDAEVQAPDPLGGALAVPPLGAAPKAKGKGKGKRKSTAKPTGSLFDEGATEVKPQAATSPGASLFDEPPVQAASPAKTGSSLFDDDAPAPLEKAGLKASPGMGSLFDDEPLPKPSTKAKAPAAKMAPATKGKGKSAPSLLDEGPQANAAPKAATKPTIAASLFDDEPAFSKPPAKAQAASSLFGEDPLFNDAPKAGPKRDSSGPLKLGGGGSIFDDDATRTAPSGEGLGLLATLAPRPQRQERSSPEASPATGEPKVEAQEASKPAGGLFGDEVRPNPLFGAAATATSSPKRKSRLDSLDQDMPVPAAAAAPAKASGSGVAGGSLFGGSGRLAKNLFDDDDDDMVKQAAEGDAPMGEPKAAPEPSKPGGGLFGDNEVRSNPLFGTEASAPSTRKPRLDSNEEDAPAAAPAAAAAAVPFAPPTVAAKASGGPGGPSLFGGSGRIAKDIFDDDDDDVAKQAETNLSSTLFAAASKASVERPEEGEVVSKAASAALAEPSKPVAGGLFEDNEVRSNPLFGTAASAPSTRKPRLDSNDEDAPAAAPAAAAAAAVPFAPPVVAAKASSGPSLFGGSGRLAKDIFDDDDDDDVVKQAPSGSSGLFGAVPPAAPLVKKAEPPGAPAGEAQATAGSAGRAAEASKPVAGLFGDSEVRFNPLSGSAPASSMLRKSSLDSLDGDAPAPAAPAPAAAAAAPAAAPAAAATVPFAPPLVAAKAGGSGGPSLFGGSGRLATNIFDDDDDDGFVKQAAPTGSAVSSLFGAAVAAPAAAVAQATQAAAEPLVAGDDAPKTFWEGQAVASEAPKPAAGGLFGDSEVRFNPLSASAPAASSTQRKSSLDSVDGDAPAPAPAAATLPFAPPLVAAKAGPSGGPSLFGGSGRMATSIFDDDDDDDFVKQAAPTGSTQTGSTLSSLFGAPQAPADPLEKLAGPKTEPKPAAEEKSSDPLGGKRVFKPPL